MSLQIKSPVDFNAFACSRLVIGSVGSSAAGGVYFDVNGGPGDQTITPADGCLVWYDSVSVPH